MLQLIRFVGLSAFSFTYNIVVTAVMVDLCHIAPEVSFLTSVSTVCVINFAACRWFVFAGSEKELVTQFCEFLISTGGFRLTEYAAFLGFHSYLGLPYLPVVVSVLGVSFAVKFLFYRSTLFAAATEIPSSSERATPDCSCEPQHQP